MSKIVNKIYNISKDEIKRIEQKAKEKNYYYVILDGKNIQYKQEYLDFMYEKFDFPYKNEENHAYDCYMDWIRDLSWLFFPEDTNHPYDGFVLVIDNYNNFLDNDQEFKEFLNKEGFSDILTWWDTETETCRYKGSARSFNIYLVAK